MQHHSIRAAIVAVAGITVLLFSGLTASVATTQATEDCYGLVPTIVGTETNDELTGTDGDDVIDALGGDDLLRGLDGRDTICGGPGHDETLGRAGIDTCRSPRNGSGCNN